MINPVYVHSVAAFFYKKRLVKVASILDRINILITGCHIPACVYVGENVQFKHWGRGVIIHHKARIEDDVVIMPNVVIGQDFDNTRPDALLQSIVIDKGAIIGAGAVILARGVFRVGKNSVIGANAVVKKNVGDAQTVVGVPGKILK